MFLTQNSSHLNVAYFGVIDHPKPELHGHPNIKAIKLYYPAIFQLVHSGQIRPEKVGQFQPDKMGQYGRNVQQ